MSDEISFNVSNDFSTSSCHICPFAKFHRLSFPSSNHISLNLFELLRCDIWGPYAKNTYNGKRFFLTLVDNCSHFTWIFLLKHKSEAEDTIK